MNTRNLLPSLTAILVCASIHAADIKPDMKFMKEAAEKVWSTENADFNPKTELTDSIYADCSAVYIAVDNVADAKRREATPFGPYRGLNRQYLGETTLDYYTRYMVKLNDANAVQEFTEHEFDAKTQDKILSDFVIYSQQDAFGAKIHKSDGTVVDVDVSTALPVTEGKKNKASKFKIAIPGLEPGDVLEYFIFTRQYMLGNQKAAANIPIMKAWPIYRYSFTGTVDNVLTTELNTFNGLGAEVFEQSTSGDREVIKTGFENVEKLGDEKYCNFSRQVPYLRISVADNVSRVFPNMATARKPGVYFNLMPNIIMAECAEYFQYKEIYAPDASKAWGIVKNYRKSHPEAEWEEIADAAWMAARYVAVVSEKSYNEWSVVSLFKDLLEKAKISEPATLAVTTSRTDIPVREIAGATQATPICIVGERVYLADNNYVYMPGEVPGKYQGETALTLGGPRSKVFTELKMGADTIQASNSRINSETFNVMASINPENEAILDIAYDLTATGSQKSIGSAFLSKKDIIELSEDFLGIKESKRSKERFDVVQIDDSRREALEQMPKLNFDIENFKVDSVSIISPGFLPGNNTFEYRITGSVDNLVTNAGGDLLLSVGKLAGASGFPKIDPSKPRDIDIYTSGPYSQRYNFKLKVPDGYTVDASSLEALNTNKANICGNFFVQANYDPQNNTVNISTKFINKRLIYPAKVWEDFLDLRRAAHDFADATIILTPQ